MNSHRVSTSTATNTGTTTTSINTSGVSQPESAAGQRPQSSSFAGTPTTTHTPKPTHVPAADQQHTGLSLLSEVSASQLRVDPFEALATHRIVTFGEGEGDEHQEQPDDSSLLSNGPSQPVEANAPIVREKPCEVTPFISLSTNVRETNTRTTTCIPEQETLPSINDHFRPALSGTAPELLLTAITKVHQLPIRKRKAGRKTGPTDERIILTEDPKMPFKCGYEGCNKRSSKKSNLKMHFFVHTRDSRFRCHLEECAGEIKFRDKHALNRHICAQHTHERLFPCRKCDWRFGRKDTLLLHMKKYHPEPLGVKAIELSSGDSSGAIEHDDHQELALHFPRKYIPDSMRRYKCEICSKRFVRRDHLKYHREHVHSNKNKKKTET